MLPAQRVNCCEDNIATAALIAAVDTNEFILSIFLSEKVCVEISGEQVTAPPQNAITDLWGEQVAQELYDRRGMVTKCDFPFVYWEGMERVTRSFKEMFRVWVTKHVSSFQETNSQLSRISNLMKNICPSCGCQDKATSHITQCRDQGWSHIYTDLLNQLVQWLGDQQTDSKVIHLFKRYLLAQGSRTRMLLLQPGSQLGVKTKVHNTQLVLHYLQP